MRRKQQMKAQAAATASSDAPPSPASTGAMDDLLQKLRAQAPTAKDQRDRRRRARLKDKHQVRVASGQKIPETGENLDETGLLSPTKTDGSEPSSEGPVSEGEDIADRAASMLQGLRGDGEGEAPARDESLRLRRRRESADDERAKRRARRRAAGTSVDHTARSTITEEDGPTDQGAEADNKRSSDGSSGSQEAQQLPTPTTIVVPPSPTTSERDP
jgi:cytokinesis protein